MTTTTTQRDFRLGHDISNTRTLQEALQVAELNWSVDLVPAENITVFTENGVLNTRIPGRRLAVRTDTGVTLETVGAKYTVINNWDTFALGGPLLQSGARPDRAGSLDFGRRVFMDFAFPQHDVKLAGGKDLVTFGARISTSHDGSGKAVAQLKGKRLWCTNGCTVDIAGTPHTFSVGHTSSAEARLRQAAKILEGAGEYVAAFTGAAERLLNTRMTEHEFSIYIDALFPLPAEDAGARTRTLHETRRGELLTLFRFADTNDLGRGTRWAGFNSVTEWLDWGTRVRQGDATSVEEARAIRQFDNANQEIRDLAWNFALAA